MKFLVRVVMGLSVSLVGAGGLAQGQVASAPPDAAWAEMSCVYDALSDEELFLLVDNYFAPDPEEVPQAEATLRTRSGECGDTHGWTGEQSEHAAGIALLTAVIDVAADEMERAGVTNVDRLLGFHQTLSGADFLTFQTPEWASDAAFVERMKNAMVERGVVGDDGMMEIALLVVEATCLVESEIAAWMEQRGFSLAPAN